jgi:hypothetical protein
MADGGFAVKIDGKLVCSCYAIEFDYDEWQYKVNNSETHPLPDGTSNISIDIEAS